MEGKEKLLCEGVEEKKDKMKYATASEKAAYFDILRLWVNQAWLHQNASQCFPYYMMTANPTQTFPIFPGQNLQQPRTHQERGGQRDEGKCRMYKLAVPA